MFNNLIMQFVKKALYGVVAAIATIFLAGASGYQPEGDSITRNVITMVVGAIVAGLTGVLKRLATWDPAKVGK